MIGTRVGNWVLEAEVGPGGMGTVYRARPADPDAPGVPAVAAVKLLTHPVARAPAFVQRFPAEVLGLRRLTHPNLARLYDCGVHAGTPYYAAEYADGPDAAALLARHEKTPDRPGLSWSQVVFSVAVQAARALKHAHHRSVLHRDLKPSNFVLKADGVLKLTDCGVAKVYNLPPLTLPGDPLGTAGYLAPEHFTGKPVTRKSDLYALGGVLYTMLTGRPPFAAATAAELMHKHCYMLPDRPANFVPKLPPEFDELICALLAKDPSRRPATAAALLEELDRLRGKFERKGERVVFPPDPGDPTGSHVPLAEAAAKQADAERAGRGGRRVRAAVLVGLLLAAVGLMAWAFFRPQPPAEELWAGAEVLLSTDDPDAWDRAKDEYLDKLADVYPDYKPEDVQAARQRVRDRKELRRLTADGANAKYTSAAERAYHRGLRLAQAGDAVAARATWDAVVRAFAAVPAERRWAELAKTGLAELDRRPQPRGGPGPAAALAEVEKLRAAGQAAAADDMLKALEYLYRDQPDALELIRRPR